MNAPTPSSRRPLLLAALLSALLALPGCERAAAPPKFKGVDLTGASYGREFRLLDPDGRQRTLSDFKGKVVMLFFGYTQCPDVCPTALARASNLRQQLGSEADLLQVIFVTVDPERDTPEILKAYTGAFDPTFIGLHGDLASTATTAKEFRVYYAKMGTGTTYTMDHSAFTYLFDKQGHLRVALSHTQPTSDFAADIRTLLRSS